MGVSMSLFVRLIVIVIVAALAMAAAYLLTNALLTQGPNLYVGALPGVGSSDREDLQLLTNIEAAHAAKQSAWFSAGALALSALGLFGVAVTVVTAFESLSLTRKAIEIQTDTTQVQLRAYVGVLSYTGATTLTLGKPIKLQFRIKNYGQTPAQNTRISYGAELCIDPNKPSNSQVVLSDGPYISRNLSPGADSGTFYTTDIVLTRPMMKAFESENNSILYSMQIDYDDLYGSSHQMRFSVYLFGRDLKNSKHNAGFLRET